MAEVGIISMVQNSGNFASEANGPDVPGTFISKASEFFDFSEIAELFVRKFIFHLSFHFGDKA